MQKPVEGGKGEEDDLSSSLQAHQSAAAPAQPAEPKTNAPPEKPQTRARRKQGEKAHARHKSAKGPEKGSESDATKPQAAKKESHGSMQQKLHQ